MAKYVYIIGTRDTKDAELCYLRTKLSERGVLSRVVDVSTGHNYTSVIQATDVVAWDVASCHPHGPDAVFGNVRGSAIAGMSDALLHYLSSRPDVAGVLALGGSGGSALVAPALQAMPIGIPKILVSTVASGNVAPYVGGSDIAMLYSVVDMQGLNRVSRRVLENAANAMAGMVRSATHEPEDQRPAIGLTMFGVTTPCVTHLTDTLHHQFDCLVFHATGTGGRSMEQLIDRGVIRGVIDVTTTEFCDLIANGIFPCGEDRLGAVERTKVPYVGSCGGLDMVNFAARDTVPQNYRNRVLVEHNPHITLMRTSAEECRQMGQMIAERLNHCEGPVTFFIPEGGFSLLDAAGEVFFDPEADEAFVAALSGMLRESARRRLIRLPYALNDSAFAQAMADEFQTMFKETEFNA